MTFSFPLWKFLESSLYLFPVLWNFTWMCLVMGLFQYAGHGMRFFSLEVCSSVPRDPLYYFLVISSLTFFSIFSSKCWTSQICSIIFHFHFSPIFSFAFKISRSGIIPWTSSNLYWLFKNFLSHFKVLRLFMFFNYSLTLQSILLVWWIHHLLLRT